MLFDLLKSTPKITNSKDYFDFLASGSESMSGVSVSPESAFKFAPVYACIRVKQESLGQLPFNLYQAVGTTKNIAHTHAVHKLLKFGPNDFQTSQEWREMMSAHLDLRGNAYCWINRVRGQVRELLPINPDSISAKLTDDFEAEYTLRLPEGEQIKIDASEILHLKLGSTDGINGRSPIAQARDSIGLGIATQRHGSRLFKNGARPSGVLSTDSSLSEEQIPLIKEQWESVQGGENALRTAILQGGLKWTTISMTAEDSQFLETRKYQRSEIAGIFRVPPHMIGDMEKATYANIEQQSLDYAIYSLMPLAVRLESGINKKLLTEKERDQYFCKINAGGLVRGDMKARAEFYTKMLHNGAISPNEIRQLEDMNPRNGGDVYLTPMNMLINGEQQQENENEN